MPFDKKARQRLILSMIPVLMGVITVGIALLVVVQSKPAASHLPESEAREVVAEINRHGSNWLTVESNLTRALRARDLYRTMALIDENSTAKLRDVSSDYFPTDYGDFMYVEFELAATYESQLEAMHATAQKHFNFYTLLVKETEDLRFGDDVSQRMRNWRTANSDPKWFTDVLLAEANAHEAYIRERREKELAQE